MRDALADFRSGEMKLWETGVGFEEYKRIVGFDDWAATEEKFARSPDK